MDMNLMKHNLLEMYLFLREERTGNPRRSLHPGQHDINTYSRMVNPPLSSSSTTSAPTPCKNPSSPQARTALPQHSCRHHQCQLQDRQIILQPNRTIPGHLFMWTPIHICPLLLRLQLHPRPPSQKLASPGDHYILDKTPQKSTPAWCSPHSPHHRQRVLPHHAKNLPQIQH